MGLRRVKLGDFLARSDSRNSNNQLKLSDVRGISIEKQFINTKADMANVSLLPYKLVVPNAFSYVTVTSRNGNKITLAFNDSDSVLIVSSSYEVFSIRNLEELEPRYLFMFFNRSEFDRYARFNSWGSARETFSWEDLCATEINLPPIEIQRKYVAVYESMLANQQAYEQGLDDLKLTCEAYIENLRKELPNQQIGQFLTECTEKNQDKSVHLAQGVDVNMQFIPAKREAEDKENTKIVRKGQFAFNKVVKSNGTKLPIALRRGDDCVVSSSYQVFEVKDTSKLLPEYLMLWLSRPETQRHCGFNAWGSTRDVFAFDELCKLGFPIPDIHTQQDIVNIYCTYVMHREINEQLKSQLKDICPVLIKGSIEEASN